jgi:hypothetical protein
LEVQSECLQRSHSSEALLNRTLSGDISSGFPTPRGSTERLARNSYGAEQDQMTPPASMTPSESLVHLPDSNVRSHHNRQEIMDLHFSTLNTILDLSREEELLIDDCAQGKIDFDVYTTALDILIDEKLKKLSYLKRCLRTN